MHQSTVYTFVALCIASTLVDPATSTYLSMQPCGGDSNIAPWAIYMSGSCFTAWESPRRGVCNGTHYESYICADNQCNSCTTPEILNMTQCIDSTYMTCSKGEPDYSWLGKNYVVAQAYETAGCDGKPIGSLAGPINKCLVNPAPPVSDPNSVYITCEKGVVTAALYADHACESLLLKWTAHSGQCSLDSGVPFPIKARCVTGH